MSEWETIRIVGEVLTAIGIAGSGFYWLARLLWRTNTKIDSMHTKLDKINGTVARHDGELQLLKEQNAWFSGVLGEPKPGERGRDEKGRPRT